MKEEVKSGLLGGILITIIVLISFALPSHHPFWKPVALFITIIASPGITLLSILGYNGVFIPADASETVRWLLTLKHITYNLVAVFIPYFIIGYTLVFVRRKLRGKKYSWVFYLLPMIIVIALFALGIAWLSQFR